MPRQRHALRGLLLVAAVSLSGAGCTSSPFASSGGQAMRPPSPMAAQFQELNTRAGGLDAQNQHLHAALAQQQQQTLQTRAALQKSQQEVADLRRQLNDGGGSGGSLSIAGRGTPARNASFGALPLVKVPGADVVPDGDLVRIRLESSQLFAPGRADLKPDVAPTLDRVAQVLRGEYAGHLVGIEGHTDNDPITKSKWHSNHELAVARSVALFQALKSRGVSESQLFVAGYGPNHPLTANNSSTSKAQNRRVEVVVYPESVR